MTTLIIRRSQLLLTYVYTVGIGNVTITYLCIVILVTYVSATRYNNNFVFDHNCTVLLSRLFRDLNIIEVVVIFGLCSNLTNILDFFQMDHVITVQFCQSCLVS